MTLKLKLNLIEDDFILLNLLDILKTDQNLNWKYHINNIAVKLNRANALLFKVRNFVKYYSKNHLHFAIFDLILIMQIWFGLKIQML